MPSSSDAGKLLKVNSQDFELDEMTASEVGVDTCLGMLRLSKSYGMNRSYLRARRIALQRFEEVESIILPAISGH